MTLVFFLMHLTPGDPAMVILGDRATPEMLEQVRQQLGLDKPLVVQYFVFLSRYLSGDMGRSLLTKQPVLSEIAERYPHTLHLAIGGFLFSVLLGVPAGVLSAVRHNSLIDQLAMVLVMLGVAAPSFFIGTVLLYFFAVKLRWFPALGAGEVGNLASVVRHAFLPSLAVGFAAAAAVARMTRSSMLEALESDYIRTARAKGLSERVVIYKHALRNAGLPVVTVLGLNFGELIGSGVVVASVFTRPGLGRRLMYAVSSRDFPVIQGITFVVVVSFVFVNLLVDILYSLIDPRIRYQ
jgi:peptide/nickel transport system permease protein